MSKFISYKGWVFVRQDSYRNLNDARRDILTHLNKAVAIMEDVIAESQIPTHLPLGALKDIIKTIDNKIKEVEKRNAAEAKRAALRKEQRRKEIVARRAN